MFLACRRFALFVVVYCYVRFVDCSCLLLPFAAVLLFGVCRVFVCGLLFVGLIDRLWFVVWFGLYCIVVCCLVCVAMCVSVLFVVCCWMLMFYFLCCGCCKYGVLFVGLVCRCLLLLLLDDVLFVV